MALCSEDDGAFEAALTFLDEFPFAEGEAEAQAPWESDVALVPRGVVTSSTAGAVLAAEEPTRSLRHAPRCRAPLLLEASEDEATKRRKVNERKKLLRKTGVYGDPNRARNARRLEIAYLKDQLAKLQADLQTLQDLKSCASGRSEKRNVSSALSTLQIPSMWQSIADSQRRRREGSELENVRLKLIVERQQKVADNLRDLLRKRANQLVRHRRSSLSCPTKLQRKRRPHIVHVLDFRGDITDFEALFRLNEAAYREVDAIFTDNGLADMVVSPSDVHIREGVGGNYLELFANKVLPFKLSDATEAAWDHFKGIKKHASNGSIYEKAAKASFRARGVGHSARSMMSAESPTPRTPYCCCVLLSRADIKVKQVVRRYVEPDRDVVIWISHVSPTEIKHKMLRGLTYHLRGYALTKRSPASTPERELSQLQFCSLISLDQEPGTRYDPANARVLINFLIGNTVQNIRNHQERIESALLAFVAGSAVRREHSWCSSSVGDLGIMALLESDDDDKVVQATMSFIDEFSFEEPAAEAAPAVIAVATKAPAQELVVVTRDSKPVANAGAEGGQAARCKVPSILPIDTTGMTRREKIIARNARKKLLRKAGIYGDSNRVRNERKLEIAYLRERIEKLQIDLKALQTHKGGSPTTSPEKSTQQHQAQMPNALVLMNSTSQISSVWQEIADRQQRRRKEAERENIHLKLIMERQRKVANTLIIEEFTKEVYSNSSRADVKMKQVVRRFVEPDRDIVIWVASVAPTEIKHKMLKGLTYHLRGYALTKRSPASTPSQQLSQLQFCYLISLDQDIATRYGPDNMRALTNFLIVNTAQNMRVHQSGIENRLIDQAFRRQLP
ncbi:unnamed protein product [Phytophthora lilii]|uniref:Unnamed protein product n=1 Tax=Phytophthora lilii TaxID=2077276 RepID=A0A9W6TRJ8_9STRA|nr:unnamed protein product [Phytophthora lilii]